VTTIVTRRIVLMAYSVGARRQCRLALSIKNADKEGQF
jgi:hypothetical protein